PAVFDPHVLTFDKADFLATLPECGVERRDHVWRVVMKKTNHRQRRLLRARSKRPSGGSAAKRDYKSPPSDADRHLRRPNEIVPAAMQGRVPRPNWQVCTRLQGCPRAN